MPTPTSWRGTDIQTGNYRAFLALAAPFEPGVRPVLAQAPGSTPQFVRADQSAMTFELPLDIVGGDLAAGQDALAQLFARGLRGPLVATFEDATTRARDCVALGLRGWRAANRASAILLVEDPRWRSSTEQSTSQAVTASGETWTVTNDGNSPERAPRILIKPTSAKASTDGWLYKWEVPVANRTDRPLINYSIIIEFDHATEVTASRSNADGSDVRVLIDGQIVHFDVMTEATRTWNQATTRLVVPIDLQPKRTADVLTAMTASVPATGGDLEVSAEGGGVAGFTGPGALLVGSEVIAYEDVNPRNAAGNAEFVNITRGARNTTAASHAAGATLYQVEKRVQLMTGWGDATAPVARPALKTLLDLGFASLDNDRRKWASFIDDDNPRRADAWERVSLVAGGKVLAAFGGEQATLNFEYQSGGPVAGKAPYTRYRLACPVPVDTAANALQFTRVVDDTLALLLYGEDADGNEVLVATYVGALASAVAQETPADPLHAVILEGRSQVMSSFPANGVSNTVAVASSAAVYFSFVAQSDGVWKKTSFRIASHAAGAGSLNAAGYADNGSTQPDTANALWADTAVHDESHGAGNNEDFEVDHTDITIYAGQRYWIGIWSTGANNTQVRAYMGSHPRYVTQQPAGTALQRLGHVRAISVDADPDPTADADDADIATGDGFDVALVTADSPYVNVQAREDAYYFDGAVLENVTTGQQLQLNLLCALDDVIEIDVKRRLVRNLTTGELLVHALTPSDRDGWMELAAGANTLKFTEGGLVGVTVEAAFFDWWE